MNTEYQLKWTLTWPVCSKSMKLTQKWSKSKDYSLKCCFYWIITWKLLLSGGGELKFGGGRGSLLAGNFSRWGGRANFWLVGENSPTIPPVGKTLYIYIYIYIYIWLLSEECYIHETQCNNKILEFCWLQDIYIYIYIYMNRENFVYIGFSLCVYIYIV